jgi:hypothetical protein
MNSRNKKPIKEKMLRKVLHVVKFKIAIKIPLEAKKKDFSKNLADDYPTIFTVYNAVKDNYRIHNFNIIQYNKYKVRVPLSAPFR